LFNAIDDQNVVSCLVVSNRIYGQFSGVQVLIVKCIHERTSLCLKLINPVMRFVNSFVKRDGN